MQYRLADGRKHTERGSRVDGFFIPRGLDHSGDLYLAEGASDTAYLSSLGLSAIGRYSKSLPNRDVCKRLIKQLAPKRGIICVDNDADNGGENEARDLAALLEYFCEVRMRKPAEKDIRDSQMSRDAIEQSHAEFKKRG